MKKDPKMIDGNGEHNSCFHACIMSDRIRFQVNANDVLYLNDKKKAREIGKWFLKAANVLPRKKRVKKI
jgi:hypothetical protein